MIPWREGVADVEAILAALTVSPDAIVLGGRSIAAPPAAHEAALGRLLYEECFIKGLEEREPPRRGAADVASFVAELSARNAGTGRRGTGWRLDGWDADDRAIVRKDGRRHRVARELVRISGDTVEIDVPKEDLRSSDVFYFAYGDALPLGEPAVVRTRCYANVSSEGAPPLVEALTRKLNARRIPFSLKCFRDPHEYYRRDGLVVYADARWADGVWAVVCSAAADLRPFVRDATPIFTHRLAAGIASAPEPESESYGQRCCRILARAILATQATSAAEIVAAAERLSPAGG